MPSNSAWLRLSYPSRRKPSRGYLSIRGNQVKHHEIHSMACFQAQVSCAYLCCSSHFVPCYCLVVIGTFFLFGSFPFLLPPSSLFTYPLSSSRSLPLFSSTEGEVPGPLPECGSKLLCRSDRARTEAPGLQLGKSGRRHHREATTHPLLCKTSKDLPS